MAPRKTATKPKGRGKGKAPVLAGPTNDHVLAKRAMKAKGAQPRSSFDRNIQRLLNSRDEPTTNKEESSVEAGPSTRAARTRDGTGSSAAAAQEDVPSTSDDTTRQLQRLDSVSAEIQELRQLIVNGTSTAKSRYAAVAVLIDEIYTRTNRTEDIIGDINQRTESMNDDLRTLSESVEEINMRTDNLVGTVGDMDVRTDAICEELQTVSETVSGMEATVDTTANDVANVEVELEQIRAENYAYHIATRDRMESMERNLGRILTILQDVHGY